MVGTAILFSDQPGTCETAAAAAQASPLLVQTCEGAPGTYDVSEDCLGDGTGADFGNAVKIAAQGADLSASSGTITIEAFDVTCGAAVRGSFAVEFDGEALSGTFDTVSCGTVQL